MSTGIWQARADTMSLTRPIPGAPNQAHALVYNITERGSLEVFYAIVDADGNILEKLATVDEYVSTRDLGFIWPEDPPQIYVGVPANAFVGAKVSTGEGGIIGSHVTDRLVYLTSDVLPAGIGLRSDGYLQGTCGALDVGKEVAITVHDTSSGTTLSRHVTTMQVTRNSIPGTFSGNSVPITLKRSPGTRAPVYGCEVGAATDGSGVVNFAKFRSDRRSALVSEPEFTLVSGDATVACRARVVPDQPLDARSDSESAGYPASAVLDLDTATEWRTAPTDTLPQSLEIDVGGLRQVRGLVYHASAWPRGRVSSFSVYRSLDGSTYGADPIHTGTLQNAVGEQRITFTETTICQTLRFTAVSFHAGVSGPAAIATLIPEIDPPRSDTDGSLNLEAIASSEDASSPARNALDGGAATVWRSQSAAPAPSFSDVTGLAWLDIVLDGVRNVHTLRYTAPPRGETGAVADFAVYMSEDGIYFDDDAIATGTLTTDSGWQDIEFAPVYCRALRLVCTSTHDAEPTTVAIARVSVLARPREKFLCHAGGVYAPDIETVDSLALVVADDTVEAHVTVAGTTSYLSSWPVRADASWKRYTATTRRSGDQRMIALAVDGTVVDSASITATPSIDTIWVGARGEQSTDPVDADVSDAAVFDAGAEPTAWARDAVSVHTDRGVSVFAGASTPFTPVDTISLSRTGLEYRVATGTLPQGLMLGTDGTLHGRAGVGGGTAAVTLELVDTATADVVAQHSLSVQAIDFPESSIFTESAQVFSLALTADLETGALADLVAGGLVRSVTGRYTRGGNADSPVTMRGEGSEVTYPGDILELALARGRRFVSVGWSTAESETADAGAILSSADGYSWDLLTTFDVPTLPLDLLACPAHHRFLRIVVGRVRDIQSGSITWNALAVNTAEV